MSEILKLKSEQCPEFRHAIMEDDRILSAAICDPFWGTCLSVKDRLNARPDFWPGKNMIGALQMELRNILKGDKTNEPGMIITNNKDIAIDSPQQRDNDEENATVKTKMQGSSQAKLNILRFRKSISDWKAKKDSVKMNERPSRGINRGQGSTMHSESLDSPACNEDKANDIENTVADTPRREQMNILEFMRERKNTGTPPKEDGKQPKLPNLRDSAETEPEGTSDCTTTANNEQCAASNTSVS